MPKAIDSSIFCQQIFRGTDKIPGQQQCAWTDVSFDFSIRDIPQITGCLSSILELHSQQTYRPNLYYVNDPLCMQVKMQSQSIKD